MKKLENGNYEMSKIDIIKAVRYATNIGLVEAKQAVERYLFSESLRWEVQYALSDMRDMIRRDNSGAVARDVKRFLGLE